jgi:hypothetical protein
MAATHSTAWCPPIKDMYLAYGVVKVVAVFLVEFPERSAERTTNYGW